MGQSPRGKTTLLGNVSIISKDQCFAAGSIAFHFLLILFFPFDEDINCLAIHRSSLTESIQRAVTENVTENVKRFTIELFAQQNKASCSG